MSAQSVFTYGHLTDAVEVVLTTWDFCGNARQALADWESDNITLTEAQRLDVFQVAQGAWDADRRGARS